MKRLMLEIVTPDKTAFRGEVNSCVLPGLEGYFGVLPGHCAFATILGPGEAKFTCEGATEHLAISGGFAQVEPTKVRVLAETAERSAEIDVVRAKAQRDLKSRNLGLARMDAAQSAVAQASLLKELVRLKIGERRRPS